VILCSCNLITSTDIELSVEKLFKEGNLTPKKVLAELGWVPNCRICVNNLVEKMVKEKKKLTSEP